jgi:GNAT superfamily N-acetyltransferase
MLTFVNPDDVEVLAVLDEARLSELSDLFSSAWWASARTVPDLARMVASSDLVVALIHRLQDRLVGFARVLTDHVYIALVLDVVVAPETRGSGLGAMLMDAIVTHPALAEVKSLELVCQPELVAFYRRWGFSDQVGRSRLMRRTCDPRLTASWQPET